MKETNINSGSEHGQQMHPARRCLWCVVRACGALPGEGHRVAEAVSVGEPPALVRLADQPLQQRLELVDDRRQQLLHQLALAVGAQLALDDEHAHRLVDERLVGG